MADARRILRELEEGRHSADDALAALARAAHEAATSALRLDACRGLGALAGRAHGAEWETAERAAFALLEVARDVDAPAEKAQLLSAMGRAFRNVWLLPYVHARLGDEDPVVVEAAVGAAGGLAFPALEEALAAGFLGEDTDRRLRLAAIAALGRMGAESAAERIFALIGEGDAEAAAALSALTEIRSRVGEAAALAVLSREPRPAVRVAAVRYLAEIGHEGVLGPLRALARDDDAELRIAGALATRAFHAERSRDAAERILSALTETDRAARAALARRLRTLPVTEVIEQATLLLADDAEGVVQVVAEVRAPEVTRMLVQLAADPSADPKMRARAAGSVEANEPWEREALVGLVKTSNEPLVRVAAAQTIGAFATPAFLLSELAGLAEDPSPALRGALLWALQLCARPGLRARPTGGRYTLFPTTLGGDVRARAEAIVRRALGDADPVVRRRAAYVAGNLDAVSLVPELVALAREETERADLRVGAFVALGEIGSADRIPDSVHLFTREDDPVALGAAARALERAATAAGAEAEAAVVRVRDRLPKLFASPDARVRAAAARVAGLVRSAVAVESVAALTEDASPRVREQAVGALGRLGGAGAERALVEALGDADPIVQERAAEALLARGTSACAAPVLDFVARTTDDAAALRVLARVTLPEEGRDALLAALDAALAQVGHDRDAYEPLLELKLRALPAMRPSQPTAGAAIDVDAAIIAQFPTWTRLSGVRGFAPLAKSLRTAEMLYGATGSADTDQSASIVLWTKSLEGYLHAWLAPRLASLQRQPAALWDLVDDLVGRAWPAYQRWLVPRWTDPVKVGGMSVDVPLRSVVNALRDLSERRLKHLDSPMSVTEWSRMMLFLALDHPTGPKNVLGVTCKDAERAAKLAHRLQVLAQVRNAATHRQVAGALTLGEFRTMYYAAFEELTSMA